MIKLKIFSKDICSAQFILQVADLTGCSNHLFDSKCICNNNNKDKILPNKNTIFPTASVAVLSHVCLHLHPTTGLVFNNGWGKSAVWVQRQLLWLLRLVVRLDFRAAELRDVL